MNATVASRVGRTSYLDKRVVERVVDGEHLLVDTGTIITLDDSQTRTAEIVRIVRVVDWFHHVDFEPVEVDTPCFSHLILRALSVSIRGWCTGRKS